MNGERFNFKEVYNFFKSMDYTDGSIPSDIMYELHKCTKLTEEVFLKACRKVYRNHLKQLKKQTKVELLFIDSIYYDHDFSLCAARKETKEEEKIRLDKENAYEKIFKDNLKTKLKTIKKLDEETIDEMIEILNKRKNELTTK